MDKSFLVVITGASRGFGRAVALSLAKNAASIPVHFRLTASTASTPLLTSLSDQIKDIRKTNETIIECMTADLSDMAAVSNISSFLFTKPISEMTYSHLIFINNHGSLGELSLVGTHDAAKMQSAFTVNITSSCFLSSESIRHSKTYPGINVRIVNVSSLCAIQPFQSWGEYCAGKAARDMYHRVIAEEYKDTNIRTFNWVYAMATRNDIKCTFNFTSIIGSRSLGYRHAEGD
jgi:sepiapterin reductase